METIIKLSNVKSIISSVENNYMEKKYKVISEAECASFLDILGEVTLFHEANPSCMDNDSYRHLDKLKGRIISTYDSLLDKRLGKIGEEKTVLI